MTKQVDKTSIENGNRHGMVALQGEGEAQRNRLLRRMDWRFLAGKPKPSCALVQGDGMLAQALELVSDEVCLLREAASGDADLVALINPRQVELEQAWQALHPGGALYAEWYMPLPAGPQVLRGRLEGLGFLVAGSYWPWPWPERATPGFWLPLEAPGALRFFLRNRPPAQSLAARVLRPGLQLAWKAGQRSGMLAPVCMVAHKPLETGKTHMPPGSLAARAATWGLDEKHGALSWLLLTGGLHSTNKVTGLVFRPGEDEPSYVVKMPRRELSLASLEREAEVLVTLQSGRSRPLQGVPELVFLNNGSGFPAIGETYLSGMPLYTAMQTQGLDDLARQATLWLVELVKPGPPQPPHAWWKRLVEPVLGEFALAYEGVGGEEILPAVRPELDRLGPLPLAVEHRDFSPWNIFLTTTGELSVLDWEGAEPEGFPFSDLLYFLTYLTFFKEGALESGTAPASYRQMFDPHTLMGSIASVCIQQYCARARIPEEALRPLRLMTWIWYAVQEHKLIDNSSTGLPDTRLLQRGLYLSLLQNELEMMRDG
jgi:hypothetical protein